jgi:hypothetical protein
MVTSATKGGTQKLPKKFKIVETYWRDHSLESFWEALSDGAISCSNQFVLGEKKSIFWILLKKPRS